MLGNLRAQPAACHISRSAQRPDVHCPKPLPSRLPHATINPHPSHSLLQETPMPAAAVQSPHSQHTQLPCPPDLNRRIFLLGLLAPRICSSCVALSGLMGDGHWQPRSSERSSML